MSGTVAPERYTLVDGPQAGRVVKNDHPHIVMWPNERLRFERLDDSGAYDTYRLAGDGTATWVP